MSNLKAFVRDNTVPLFIAVGIFVVIGLCMNCFYHKFRKQSVNFAVLGAFTVS